MGVAAGVSLPYPDEDVQSAVVSVPTLNLYKYTPLPPTVTFRLAAELDPFGAPAKATTGGVVSLVHVEYAAVASVCQFPAASRPITQTVTDPSARVEILEAILVATAVSLP